MRKLIALLIVAGLWLAFTPSAEARPHIPQKIASGAAAAVHGVKQFVGNRLEGVQRRHDRRVERRQSGHGLAHILRCN